MVDAVAASDAKKVPLVVLCGAPEKGEARWGLPLHRQAKTLDSQFRRFRETACDQAKLDDPAGAGGYRRRPGRLPADWAAEVQSFRSTTRGRGMRAIIELRTDRREELVDITARVEQAVHRSGVRDGLVSVYAQGATAAIMIQENWDASVPTDVVNFLREIIPPGVWLHDQQDNNGDAHLKAGLVGPSETIPIIDGKLGLSTWQGIFFCEFDGPRHNRHVVCTMLGDRE